MKANKIFRKAAAGLLSISLLCTGLPVTAAEINPEVLKQQTETAGGIGNGTEFAAASEQNSGGETEKQQNSDGSQTEGAENSQNQTREQQNSGGSQTEGAENSQNQTGEQTNPDGNQSAGTENTQNQTGEQANSDDSQSAGTEDTQNQAGETEDQQNPNDREDSDTDSSKNEDKNSMSNKSDNKAEGEKEEETLGEEQIAAAVSYPGVRGSIAIDGDLSDWIGVTERSGSGVDYWKAAFSPDGNTLYFSFTGNASTEWDYNFTKNKFQFAYPDGVSDVSNEIFVNIWQGKAEVKNAYFGDVPGAEAAVTNEAHGNNPGPYVVEFAVPVSFFHSPDFTLTFGGTAIASGDIEQVNGDSAAEDLPAVYAGISIDGKYSDWKAVAKTDASCPNSAHTGCLSQVAAVFDGDWFYLYIKDGKGSNASGAGTHSNGKFAITSDLGYETDIQLSAAPGVSGVNGAEIAYVGSEWEVAIPKDQLPKYRESLSFGLYQGEPFLSGIVNLQPDSGNNLENLFEGIQFDGQYKDWEDYGHSTIQYATAGSQESQIDAKGALYSSDGKLYGHVVTNMPQHLQEAGQEFTEAITIAFNQSAENLRNGSVDQSMVFYPRFVTVDANGTIDWNPKRAGLPEGTYEYHIVSLDAWGTSQNISDLNDMDQIYGKMIMTIGKDGKDEMEYYLELPMIAEKLGVDATNLKEIAAQYGRIGQEWIFTAGTSTGPLAGVAICVASVGIVFWYRKRKKNELIPAAA